MHWYKGNIHTHSLWSDGGAYPEQVADWYKSHGYNFLAVSDHNTLLEGERWVPAMDNKAGTAGLERYRAKFGATIDERTSAGQVRIRLKTLSELKAMFEHPGEFLLLPSEEISNWFDGLQVHLNVLNAQQVIAPPGGKTVGEILQRSIDAATAQQKATGVPMLVQVNHPNFTFALNADHLAEMNDARFFEVYNGHFGVANRGKEGVPDTDRIWDLALTRRLDELHKPLLYGLASDDTHDYQQLGLNLATPGQGWLMVRAAKLTPAALIEAMNAGQFYASTGVTLRDVTWNGKTLAVAIEPEAGVEYTTQFIGTQNGEVGKVLAESKGPHASYAATGDEVYVRAKVISSKRKAHPTVADDAIECAWVQPVRPGRK
jgi:hypothetical protein